MKLYKILSVLEFEGVKRLVLRDEKGLVFYSVNDPEHINNDTYLYRTFGGLKVISVTFDGENSAVHIQLAYK